MTWMFPPWLACLPDHHRSTPSVGPGGAAAVGFDQGAVDADVAVPSHFRRQQRRFERGRLGGENHESLMEIGIRGGLADLVVDGQLLHLGAVQKPAQQHHCLLERRQDTAALAATAPNTRGEQQTRHIQHGLLPDGQGRGV
jgi:hypothetical protein